jgi:putative RNA 2'-phosphotransferase
MSETVKISKYLSLVLRHEPDAANVTLDKCGWVDVDVLLEGCASKGRNISRQQLDEVVRDNNKQRFIFSEDGKRIRANQGHSVKVDLGYEPAAPPDILYHGTATRFLDAIKKSGLKKMTRQHVHLSGDVATAVNVGSRHGTVVVLPIKAKTIYLTGEDFFLTPNKVWLVDKVAPKFIDFENIIYKNSE